MPSLTSFHVPVIYVRTLFKTHQNFEGGCEDITYFFCFRPGLISVHQFFFSSSLYLWTASKIYVSFYSSLVAWWVWSHVKPTSYWPKLWCMLGSKELQKAVPILQVAELTAFMANNRGLSYCKVVEVIAETTAPLTPMDELLAKIPSQRVEPKVCSVHSLLKNKVKTQFFCWDCNKNNLNVASIVQPYLPML